MRGQGTVVGAVASLVLALWVCPVIGHGERVKQHLAPVVWLPSGSFVRGSSMAALDRARALCMPGPTSPLPLCPEELLSSERPEGRVWVSSYGIDRREVTVRSFRACVYDGRCVPARLRPGDDRLARPTMPVAGVTWDEARAYCRYRGGRLPTEAEWERAARGSGTRTFPWGDQYRRALSNHGGVLGTPDASDGYLYAAPVGSFPSGRSPHGLEDVAGNVWEWTDDGYRLAAYASSPRVDPRVRPDGELRVVRGGSWLSPPHSLRVTHREPRAARGAFPDVGFRCAYDAPPP